MGCILNMHLIKCCLVIIQYSVRKKQQYKIHEEHKSNNSITCVGGQYMYLHAAVLTVYALHQLETTIKTGKCIRYHIAGNFCSYCT